MELHALLQQLVGADEKVHASGPQRPQDALLLPGGGEAGQHLDLHREVPEAADGGGVVLLGQDRGGHQDGGLLPVQDALHHRPEGHLRLAVAHVAAQQPVHGAGALHVRLDLGDAPELILRLRIGEGLLELPLPGGVRGEGEARPLLPLGVQGDEALGQILCGLFGPGLLPGPVRAPQLVEPGVLGVLAAADVLAHQIQLGDGDVQAVAAGVVDLDVVLLHPVHRHPLDAGEAAHAVVLVDHQVAGGQVRVGLELLPVGVLFDPLALPHGRSGELPLRQHRQLQGRPLAAGGQGADGQPHLACRRHGGAGQIQRRRDAPLLQQPLEVPGPGLPAAEHQHRAAAVPVVLQVRDGGLQASAVRGELLGVHGDEPPGSQRVAGGGQGVGHDDGEGLQRRVQLLRRQSQAGVISRQKAGGEQRLRILLELESGVLHPLVHPAALAEEHRRIRGQIVHAGGDLRVDGRQIPVRGRWGRAAPQPLRVLPQGLDDPLRLLPAGQSVRQGGELLRQPRQAALRAVGQHLRRRKDQRRVHIPGPPLGGGVKGAHRVDLIVEELTAHRLVHQGGEHVQNAAPQGELAHALHLVAAGIPRGEQTLRQLPQLRLPTHRQGDGQGPQQLRRQGPGADRVHRGHHGGGLSPRQGIQGRQTAALPVPGAHSPGAELPLPAQQGHGACSRQGLQISGEDLDLPLVSAEEHRRTAAPRSHRRAHAGPLHRLEAADRRGAAAVLHPADQLRHLGDGLKLSEKLFHKVLPCKNMEALGRDLPGRTAPPWETAGRRRPAPRPDRRAGASGSLS